MFQPIIITLKTGEVGFCTLEFKTQQDLRERIDNMSKSPDVDRITLESHLPTIQNLDFTPNISYSDWLDFVSKNHRPDMSFNEYIKKEF